MWKPSYRRDGRAPGWFVSKQRFAGPGRDVLDRLSEIKESGSMALKPLGDRVVVEREEAKETTAGGIVLPDTAKDKPQKGKVVAVGDGRITKDGKRRELQVKVGEQVLFTSYAGEEFKIDGDKKVLLMREEDILAVIG
jgi:chaperonin GroES